MENIVVVLTRPLSEPSQQASISNRLREWALLRGAVPQPNARLQAVLILDTEPVGSDPVRVTRQEALAFHEHLERNGIMTDRVEYALTQSGTRQQGSAAILPSE